MLTTKEIQDWLVTRVAELLHVDTETIDISQAFSYYGLTSLDVVALSGELEELLGRRLSPTLAYDHPTIQSLSGYLGGKMGTQNSLTPKEEVTDCSKEPIAVIGIGCRFPGATNPESFWRILHDGLDMITEIPADRWDKHAFYHPDPSIPGKSVSYWGGFLNNIDQFDPFFFGISPIEAKYMDPQQRLLLELSYEALDNAGQTKENVNGSKTGVFIGIALSEYSQIQFADVSMITSHSGTGSALSIAANRISYFFNFHGPSVAIDTACSSSLAAVHLACQSIRNGECTIALAGGVNLILSPANSIAFTKAGVLAPDGRCKSFDADAKGYVRGEGGGVIVLKSLSSALADGDPIQAVLLGSAIRHDGRTNGLMAPSADAQEALLKDAYKEAGVLPEMIQYIESHGTGTILGDSIEAKAIGSVIGADRNDRPCLIGSVKTNIGHLEAAAGIAGLIKVILSLKNKTIPASLHYRSPNPHINFSEINVRVNSQLSQWPADSYPSLAGVSSFGFGGTNVHMVVREANHTGHTAEKKNDDGDFENSYVLPLSASSPDGLRSLADSVLALITRESPVDANDLCYAAAKRRTQFDHCLTIIGKSSEELRANLKAFVQREQAANVFTGIRTSHQQRKVVFVFSGQGGQWYGMGRELLKKEPVFFNAIELIDRIIKEHFSWSLINELSAERSVSRINDIDVIQPMLFAIQVALAKLWEHWGIQPNAVIGHSMGEVAAAHICGALSLNDAVHIVCHRSQLLKQLCGKGSMMATELSPDHAREIINEYGNDIALAAINSPVSTVLSGSTETIGKVMENLQRQNLFCKLVNVDVASHSAQIDVLRSGLQKVLSSLDPQRATVPFYSTVTGTHDENITFNNEYWIDNLRKPVQFFDAIRNLLQSGHSTFIEMGPHPLLLSSIQQALDNGSCDAILLPSLRRDEPERLSMLSTLGTLYTEGFSINWTNLYPHGGKHVPLPPISWERQSYWLDIRSPNFKNQKDSGSNTHPLLGDRINLANSPMSFIWQTVLSDEMMHLLEQHQIENEIVFPAAAYIEMAFQAAKETNLDILHELFDFSIKESMTIRSTQSTLVQTVLTEGKNDTFLFNIYSQTTAGEQWVLHASAKFIPKIKADNTAAATGETHHAIRGRCTSEFTSAVFYQSLLSHGIQYGPNFRALEHVWSVGNESLGLINFPTSLKHDSKFQIHPALLDACLQVMAANQIGSSEHDLYIPTGCRHIRFFSKAATTLWSHVMVRSGQTSDVDVVYADIRLSDDVGRVIGELIGFRLQRTSRRIRKLIAQQDTWLYQPRWLARQQFDSPLFGKRKYWLIFADDNGFGEELAKQLESNGDHCHLLLFRDVFTKPESFTDDALYAEIEKCIQNSFASLHGVIHLWSLSIPQSSAHESVMSDLTLMPGVNSVLFVLQSLTKRIARLPKLWLITRGTQSLHSDEEIAVEQSALWGLGKVISLELPALKCTRVDLDSKQTIEDGIPDIVRLVSSDDSEDQVAFRGGRRFVQRLLPFTFNKPYKKAISFRSDRTYLITGGLGALGIRIAGWLAQRGARHIVLVGRSEPSPSVISFIDNLRLDGVNVFIAGADVSNDLQLRNVFEEIENSMPELKGIFHAAGVLDDCSISNLTSEKMKKVMASKVDGTWNLHKATLNVQLDFFVLFSSAVSVLGSPGQGNYAAANSYLDAMAYFRRSRGLPAISVNWGPWADVGLAAQASEKLADRNASNDHLIKAIKIDRGLEILEQLIMEPTPQVMVLPFDLKNLIELYPTAAGIPFFAEVGGSETHVARLYARPNLRHKYVEPRNEMESKLADLWRQTLHIDRVGVHDSFFELGGDSILAAQILSLAQKAFGIRINPQDVFHAFTIEQLAEKLQNQILSEVEEMSEDEAERKIHK